MIIFLHLSLPVMDVSSLYYKLFHLPLIDDRNPYNFYKSAKNNRTLIQRLRIQKKLPVHNGCVNSICWNDTGHYLLSGSDDQHLSVTHTYTYQILASVRTGHRANIFSAKFLPNTSDRHVISCSGDGMVVFTDLERPDTSLVNIFNCHFGTAYEVTTVPNDPNTFLTCGEDGTVRWFDLRLKNNCSVSNCQDDILINCSYAVTALSVNNLMPYHLGVGCADSTVRIYDRRMLGTRALGNYLNNNAQSLITKFTVPEFANKNHRITSLCYSPDCREMLVSYSSDYIYLFDVNDSGKVAKQISQYNTGKQKLSPSSSSSSPSSSSRPFMKRLRVRGDWSDTGPNARPESERDQSEQSSRPRSLHANLMQRMSEVLTRIFNSPQRQNDDNNRSEVLVNELSVSSHSNSNNNSSQLNTRNADDGNFHGNQLSYQSPDISYQSNALIGDVTNPLSESLHNLEQELFVHHDDLIDENSHEPVVNLQFSGQGVSSGTITVESGIPSSSMTSQLDESPNNSVAERQEIDSLEPNDSNRDNEIVNLFSNYDDVRNAEESGSDAVETNDNEEGNSLGNSNARDRLIQSFDDVLKHLREEREHEHSHMTNISMPRIKQKFIGHRNARTMIKEATFWGNDFIMSGSDCGHIFVWSRETAELVMVLEGDHHVVNCLQPHPFDPILASSGIDYDIKLWAPLAEDSYFDMKKAEEITDRNVIMLEETKDTITVPASFMIRMLSSLNHLRSARAPSRWGRIRFARTASEHQDNN